MSADTAFCPEIVKYLQKGLYDIVVLTVLASPTALLAAYTLQHRKIPYYYEGDGGFAGQASGVKATLKRYIIRAAEKCLSSSKEFDRYCITYGAKPENIIRYPFTSVKKADCLTEKLTAEEKSSGKRNSELRRNVPLYPWDSSSPGKAWICCYIAVRTCRKIQESISSGEPLRRNTWRSVRKIICRMFISWILCQKTG